MSAGFDWASFDIGCTGKEGFGDKATANSVIVRMTRRTGYDARRPLNAYRCPSCRGWHIGAHDPTADHRQRTTA